MSTVESVQIAPNMKTPGDVAKTFGSDAFSPSCIYTEVFATGTHFNCFGFDCFEVRNPVSRKVKQQL